MDIDRITDAIIDWIDDVVELNEEDGTQTDLYIETFEHACILRWGSKKGDFPRIASGGFDEQYYIITSGVLNGNIVIADLGAKKEFDFENMVWKFLCDTKMEGYERGYEQIVRGPDGAYKITVEKMDSDPKK